MQLPWGCTSEQYAFWAFWRRRCWRGQLSFVGLLAPHIARRLVGNNHRILLPAAMLLGAAFVVLCDVLARCLFAPFELPVGILLSLIGGPFFLGLLLHGRGRRMYD